MKYLTILFAGTALLAASSVNAQTHTGDVTIAGGDLHVDGSACIGVDCLSDESFGFDTIRLKENNLRIMFDDTSSSASFPRNDFSIRINDTTDGGLNYFEIYDETSATTLLRLCAVADATCTNIVPATAISVDPQTALNTAAIADNTTAIGAQGVRLTAAETAIAGNTTRITAAETAITANTGRITANEAAITANSTRITAAEAGIAANSTAIAANSAGIADNRAMIMDNRNLIAGLDGRVTNLEGEMNVNRDGIATALALGAGGILLPDQTVALGVAYGNFEGSSAVGVNASGRLSDSASVTFGLGYGTQEETLGVRAGVNFGW